MAGTLLFTVKADKHTFPADVWERFRDTPEGPQGVLDRLLLRRLMEEYSSQEPTP